MSARSMWRPEANFKHVDFWLVADDGINYGALPKILSDTAVMISAKEINQPDKLTNGLWLYLIIQCHKVPIGLHPY